MMDDFSLAIDAEFTILELSLLLDITHHYLTGSPDGRLQILHGQWPGIFTNLNQVAVHLNYRLMDQGLSHS